MRFVRRFLAFSSLAILLVPTAALAGRPDYTHMTDAELRTAVLQITAGLFFMAALGLFGWLRYRQSYTPAPARFSPTQVLFSVGVFVALALWAAWAVLS